MCFASWNNARGKTDLCWWFCWAGLKECNNVRKHLFNFNFDFFIGLQLLAVVLPISDCRLWATFANWQLWAMIADYGQRLAAMGNNFVKKESPWSSQVTPAATILTWSWSWWQWLYRWWWFFMDKNANMRTMMMTWTTEMMMMIKKRIFTPAASALSNSRANIGQAWEIIIMDDGDTLISWRWWWWPRW